MLPPFIEGMWWVSRCVLSNLTLFEVRVLGRGGFKFRLPDRGEFAVVFSDWSGVEGVAGRSDAKVLYQTAKVIRKGPEARRAREAWKAAIESRR